MSVSFLRPELLVLFVPLAILAWRTRSGQHPITTGIRIILAALLALGAAGPHLRAGTAARHAVFVVDRSASMPEGSDAAAIELIDLALGVRSSGDHVHVVTFGTKARIETGITDASRGFGAFNGAVGTDGSDLAAGIESALSMIPKDAEGSIVLVSDGLADAQREVDLALLAATSRGIRVDVREVGRLRVADTAIERVEIPSEVFAGEPFLITAWVHANERQVRTVRLMRGANIAESRTVELPPGRSRLRFRSLLTQGGIGDYRVEIVPGADGADRVPENDSAVAATRALGARPVMVVNHDGEADTLTLALRGAGIPALAVTPERMPTSLLGIDSFRAVILENVSAARVGLRRMELLRSWTLDHGGGLLMTGGEASFGSGGYFRSPLDDLLPVSMEQRQEHRKLAVALSITLDRSGSMSAPAEGGTKMDLANRGTVEALRLLSANDSASVIAVDSSPHVVQAQTQLTDRGAIEDKVLGIRSQGGGIFTATALKASARELQNAVETTKHVILFADAADAEEQQDTPPVIDLLRAMGATVSVIGLGTENDPHAEFLKECARTGGGEAYFTESATELPRLFAMDTQAVARSTFVEVPTAVQGRRDLVGLGELNDAAFPSIGGYNLSYLRDGASLGAVTIDEYKAPVFAFHARGLGRVAAFTGQVGGSYGAALPQWEGFSSFFVTVSRWLSGVEPPEGVFASVRREGRDAVLSVEFDPDAKDVDLGEQLDATVSGQGGPKTITLERVSPTRFEARYPLTSGEIALTTVRLQRKDAAPVGIALPPIALPYSPEFERATDPRAGEALLRRAAARSGGVLDVATSEIFRGERGSRAWRLFTRELMLLALLLFLVEIAGRRLQLWEGARLPRRAPKAPKSTAPKSTAAKPEPTAGAPAASVPSAPGEPEPTADEAQSLASTLDAARRSSRDRLNR